MNSQAIGVFDSGVGGISTLKKLSQLLPNERFIFYGDSLHAPYGDKTPVEVYKLSKAIIEYFITKNVKAVVIACNTATSAAKERLVTECPQLPIIGIEPALKEAIDNEEHNILVMGTKLTMTLPKYQKMVSNYGHTHNIYSVACPGLAEYVESGMTDQRLLAELLDKFLSEYQTKKIESIVLGCTHYPFLENDIRNYFSGKLQFHNGYEGVANHLKNLLQKKNQLTPANVQGKVIFSGSKQEELPYYQQLFDSLT
ncbi:glutamate racemase [Enterococcus pingfangensis]|uniref:glutamate racemase n=1 Tax=Enterococcus pingfangensis TaxID=2559924 RepID=UPI0010F92E38|nr:glutamate racemase [Enterococcus pingfangensis]